MGSSLEWLVTFGCLIYNFSSIIFVWILSVVFSIWDRFRPNEGRALPWISFCPKYGNFWWEIFEFQVPFARQSLNHEDVFILDTKGKIFQFNGANSNIQERGKALEVVQHLKDTNQHGKCDVVIVGKWRWNSWCSRTCWGSFPIRLRSPDNTAFQEVDFLAFWTVSYILTWAGFEISRWWPTWSWIRCWRVLGAVWGFRSSRKEIYWRGRFGVKKRSHETLLVIYCKISSWSCLKGLLLTSC